MSKINFASGRLPTTRFANNKNSGGTTMSLNKGLPRRLSLLAGSSFVAAGVSVAISAGAILAPTAAAAQSASCVATTSPAIAGNGSSAVTLPAGTYNPGIVCNFLGDGATVTTLGNITVSSSGGVPANPLINGINLRATGTDDIRWVSTAGTVSGSTQTNGPVIDARTAGGNITINTAGVTGTSSSVTHGIFAESAGPGVGNITITTAGNVSATNATSGFAAIEARSLGGGGVSITTGGSVAGNRYGLIAEATGAGNVTINQGDVGVFSAVSGSNNNGVVGADLRADTGLITYNMRDNGSGLTNGNVVDSIGVRITTDGGEAVFNRIGSGSVSAGRTGGVASLQNVNTRVFDVTMNGGTTTVNNLATSGSIGTSNPSLLVSGLVRAQGDGNIIFNNTGSSAYGRFQLADFDGEFTLNNASGFSEQGNGWRSSGLSEFAAGGNTINNSANGILAFSAINLPNPPGAVGSERLGEVGTATLRFGAGDDTINNEGFVAIGVKGASEANEIRGYNLVIEELETFNNSGTIVFGTRGSQSAAFVNTSFAPGTVIASDGSYDDRLVMTNSQFNGLEGSRILIDAFLQGTGQTDCSRNVEGPDRKVRALSRSEIMLTANDCLDFRGTTVTGQTQVVITDTFPGGRGAYNPKGNVFVDVIGGVVESADAFILSPETDGYSEVLGKGVIDKGLFFYSIGFDPSDTGEGGQFKIYGLEGQTTQQFPLLTQSAADVWRDTAAPWIERRGMQRDEGGDLDKRFWLVGTAASIERAVDYTVLAGATSFTFDNSFTQENRSLTAGVDIGRGSLFGGEWVAGAMFGYAQADVEFETIANVAKLEGLHAGLYAGFSAGPFFQDIVINSTWLKVDNDAPSLALAASAECPEDVCFGGAVQTEVEPILSTDAHSIGGRIDTGWRFSVMERLDIEPMLSLQWFETAFDDIRIPAADPVALGGHAEFDKARSLRTGFGLRVGMKDIAPRLLPVDVSLMARSMQESDGESTVTIENTGPDAAVASNTLDGTFNELTGLVTLGEGAGHVAGFLKIGGAWGDDYEAKSASVGVRLRW